MSTTTNRAACAVLAALALATALLGLPATAISSPSPPDAPPAWSRTSATCGELFLLLVPGAGQDAGPGTTLGRLRAEVKSQLRWPRPKVGVVSWRNRAPTPRLLRGVRADGVQAAYFYGWKRAVKKTSQAPGQPRETLSRRSSDGDGLLPGSRHRPGGAARTRRRSQGDATTGFAGADRRPDGLREATRRGDRRPAARADRPDGATSSRLSRGGAVVSWCRVGDAMCSDESIRRAAVRAHLFYDHSATGLELVRRNVLRAVELAAGLPHVGVRRDAPRSALGAELGTRPCPPGPALVGGGGGIARRPHDRRE